MEKLDCKSLMNGDWLQHANGKYYQVTRIDGLSDGNIHFACGTPHLWEYNNKFKPVPLTKEILEKNGFKKYSTHCYQIVIHKQTTANDIEKQEVSIREDGLLEIFTRTCDVSIPIKYAHQLQHTFHLCGIEKEIEL